MAWWICGGCNAECFEPCDCFGTHCVLELTVSGWGDNASTDCDGIANLTFNGTHDIGGESLMSTLPYGFECELAYSFDEPVLTKEVGGNCICKDQPALYTIYASLQCGGEGPDEFLYTLHLDFHVPVYDEDEGCSPAPCAVEPKWEIWTAEPIVLYEGPLSGNPVCAFDVGPIEIAWAASPSAQTTCGLGLDGTNITVSARMKLCDPPTGNCTNCCNEIASDIPDSFQVVLSGLIDSGVCSECSEFEGTYVLNRVNGSCTWSITGQTLCGESVTITLFQDINEDGDCYFRLQFSPPLAVGYEIMPDFCETGSVSSLGTKCSEVSGLVLAPCSDAVVPPFGYFCDATSGTATITAL